MFKSALLLLSITGLAQAKVDQKIIKTLYVFGDSYSDVGKLANLTKDSTYVPPVLFPTGRFSNGPVWVEYLSKSLHADLVNNAYASATVDSDYFSLPFDKKGSVVPGCIQQVENFIKETDLSRINPNTSLVIMAFFGNDLFDSKSLSPSSYYEHLNKCATRLFKATGLFEFVIPTGVTGDLEPLLKIVSLPESILLSTKNAMKLFDFDAQIEKIIKDNPGLNVHKFKSHEAMHAVSSGKIPLFKGQVKPPIVSEACVQGKGLVYGNDTIVCKNPNKRMFWDFIHPTTALHRALANQTLELLYRDFDERLDFDRIKL